MKKFLMFLACVVVAFILTGCSSDTLTCSISDSEDGVDTSSTINVDFDNDKVSAFSMEMNVTLSDEYSSYLDTYKSLYESSFESFEEYGGDVNITTDDNSLKVELSLDVDKLSEEEKEDMGFNDDTRDSIKESFEDDGYTCN